VSDAGRVRCLRRMLARLTVAQRDGLRTATLTGGIAFLHPATAKALVVKKLGRRVGKYRFEVNARGVFVWRQSLLRPAYQCGRAG